MFQDLNIFNSFDEKHYLHMRVVNMKRTVRKMIIEKPKRRKGKWSFNPITKEEKLLKRP